MKFLTGISILMLSVMSCSSSPNKLENDKNAYTATTVLQDSKIDTATLAGGCFWCVEAAFEQIEGVVEAVSGYSGGMEEAADYRSVSSGKTKHAEAVQIYYDASKLTYETILSVFFTAHDPTQLNRQGADIGPQYRSAIFYHNEQQKHLAEKMIRELTSEYSDPIVTEINRLDGFYAAEEYHQDFQKKNPYHPYILAVSKPKVDKVRKTYPELIKK